MRRMDSKAQTSGLRARRTNMKILKSSFHFQPSDDLFPTDKFRQIIEFVKITANLKRRFVMIVTPDILTALGLVMRLEPIGNMLWQGRLEGNQFQIIPDIFHPMNKPGYILIRYIDADTVTLIEFDQHMMGVVGFDSIVESEGESEADAKQAWLDSQESTPDHEVFDSLVEAAEEPKDPRYFQVAEQVGDKYVFDPEICRPSTETCGECIHGVCCEKAKEAKRAARKETQMDARKAEPIEVQWACVAELTEKKLKDHDVPFEHKDSGSSYEVKFELGKHMYRIEFKLIPDLSNRVFISKFDLDPSKKVGSVIYGDEVNNPDSMNEFLYKLDQIIEDETVEELGKSKVERILDDAGIKYNTSTNRKRNMIFHCEIGSRKYMIDEDENNGGKSIVALYRIGDDPSDQEMLFFDADMTSDKYNGFAAYIQKLVAANTEQTDENEETPLWKTPIERMEKVLYNYRIEYTREDSGSCHYIRYENGYNEYCLYFENRDEPAGTYQAVYSVKVPGEGKVIWSGLIDSHNALRELERAVVENIKPMETEEC